MKSALTYGWDGIMSVRARIKFRQTNPHNGMGLKPECWSVADRSFDFTFGWLMGENDPYPGEVAWIPPFRKSYRAPDGNWPNNAPAWIASGDLEILSESTSL